MKKFVCLVIVALCLCQFGLAQETNRNGRLQRVNDSIFIVENGTRYMADRNVVTVKLKQGVNKSKIEKDVKELRSNRLGFIDLSVPEGVDIEDYVTMLEKTGNFDIVEYNSIGKYCFISNDTRRSEQWYLSSINAYSAWDITTGNLNVIVAVLDSGTDWGHPDLGNGTDGYSNINAAIGWNYINNNNNVITTNEHGTRVAGIIGAKTHNSRGIAGVAGGRLSRGITIMPLCIGVTTPNTAIIDDAIIDAVDNGARVINMSFGVGSSTALNSAIAYAIQNNVVLVASSGNGTDNDGVGVATVTYPASHPDVIAVGAINQSNQRAGLSNYGTNLDVVAPGISILSTTLNNNYNSQNGTSFAAPQVSGIAALILSVNPNLMQNHVRQIIESTCTKLSGYSYSINGSHPNGTWNNEVGHGLVNAYAALLAIPTISGPDVVCHPGNTFNLSNAPAGAVSWSVTSPFSITSSNNTSATVTTYNVAGVSGTLTVTVNGNIVATKTIQSCQASISGNNPMCATASAYSITGIPFGLTPTNTAWSCSRDITLSSQSLLSTNASLTNPIPSMIIPYPNLPLDISPIWIRATVTINNVTSIIEKTVSAGNPAGIIWGPMVNGALVFPLCPGTYGFKVDDAVPSGIIKWILDLEANFPHFAVRSGRTITVDWCPGYNIICMQYNDACGYSIPAVKTIYLPDCGGNCPPFINPQSPVPISIYCRTSFGNIEVIDDKMPLNTGENSWSIAYPNPASTELTIDRTDDNNNLETQSIEKSKPSLTKVLIYSHSTTKLVFSQDYPSSTKQIKIDTSKLPNGTYYLNIIENGEKVKEQTIIINH
jgi:subtilisin family serine protease